MHTKRIALMGLFASLLALFGCDKLVTSQVVFTTGADVPHLLQAASADGPIAVEAMGDAGQDAKALAARVADAMRAETSQPWLKFETDRGKTANEYRLVYLFDARTVRQPDFFAVCAGKPPRFERDPARISVHAVICGPRGPVVAVWGWVKRPDSLDDPALRRLIVQIGYQAVRGAT
ncbi:MAG: hypothetical protein HY059_10335 [Proteobacteria bacterium]|nr:hypothetical protein [Pseudomonadota bacterium]